MAHVLLFYRLPFTCHAHRESLKSDPHRSSIPIIIVTSLDDRAARLSALNVGVEDFLTKPVDRAELWVRARNLLRLKECADFLADHARIP